MYRTDKEDYGQWTKTDKQWLQWTAQKTAVSNQDQKELNWQMVTEVN